MKFENDKQSDNGAPRNETPSDDATGRDLTGEDDSHSRLEGESNDEIVFAESVAQPIFVPDESSSIHGFPDPENNESDGSTLILKDGGKKSISEDSAMSELSPADQAATLGMNIESFSAHPEESNSLPSIQPVVIEPMKDSPRTDAPPKSSTSTSSHAPNWLIISLVSYASLVTLWALFLAFGQTQNHPLESLPDVAPESVDELSYVSPVQSLPPGHRLQIGDRRRFGNIVVEVRGIRREPIEFVHYTNNPATTRSASRPVDKLMLTFTNVSEDQEIAPLDRRLTLRWVLKSEQQREYSNYYIVSAESEGDQEPALMFPLTSTSDWDMKDQQLGRILKPGESMRTYLAASEAGVSLPDGPLLWRFQFRKGFSKSGSGVTTIAEVHFDRSDVTTVNSSESTPNPAA